MSRPINSGHENTKQSPFISAGLAAPVAASLTHPSRRTGMNRIRSSVFSLLLLVLVSASAFAQTRRVSGRITVEGSGEAIVAASVNVVGTAGGTYTADKGRFSPKPPTGPPT